MVDAIWGIKLPNILNLLRQFTEFKMQLSMYYTPDPTLKGNFLANKQKTCNLIIKMDQIQITCIDTNTKGRRYILKSNCKNIFSEMAKTWPVNLGIVKPTSTNLSVVIYNVFFTHLLLIPSRWFGPM